MPQLATSGATARERVLAGIAFMDRVTPGWRLKIKPDRLNIQSDCTCAIAQVHGSFNEHWQRLFGNDLKRAADLGFYAHAAHTRGARDEYAVLTAEWKKVLAAENAAREQVQGHIAQKRQFARAAA